MDIALQRPRLSDRVRARRHSVAGERFVVLTDDARGLSLRVGEREWRLLRAMDGTRDLEGVRRAAGASTPLEEVRRFAEEVRRLDLLGEPEPDPEPAFARDVPLAVLPGARFRCDGSGDCCAGFDTVLFTPLERAAARVARPDVLDAGEAPDRAFVPAHGGAASLFAVALEEGRCAYLDADGRCGIYAVRPHGCRTFPVTYLDVGERIRVSLRPECACALDDAGPPLEAPRTGAELPRALHVPRLPVAVELGARTVDRAEYLRWLDTLEPTPEALLAEAHALSAPSQAPPARAPSPPERWPAARWAAAREEVDGLIARHAYRAPTDPTLRSLRAARRALDAGLASPRVTEPTAVQADVEARFLRATLFVLRPEPSAVEALRRLALTVLVARRVDSDLSSPLAALHALVRGHGLTWGG